MSVFGRGGLLFLIFLRLLRSVVASFFSALLYPGGVELAADDRVAQPDILNFSASEHYDGVFLKVVSFAWNVGCNFESVGKAHAGDLADS